MVLDIVTFFTERKLFVGELMSGSGNDNCKKKRWKCLNVQNKSGYRRSVHCSYRKSFICVWDFRLAIFCFENFNSVNADFWYKNVGKNSDFILKAIVMRICVSVLRIWTCFERALVLPYFIWFTCTVVWKTVDALRRWKTDLCVYKVQNLLLSFFSLVRLSFYTWSCSAYTIHILCALCVFSYVVHLKMATEKKLLTKWNILCWRDAMLTISSHFPNL